MKREDEDDYNQGGWECELRPNSQDWAAPPSVTPPFLEPVNCTETPQTSSHTEKLIAHKCFRSLCVHHFVKLCVKYVYQQYCLTCAYAFNIWTITVRRELESLIWRKCWKGGFGFAKASSDKSAPLCLWLLQMRLWPLASTINVPHVLYMNHCVPRRVRPLCPLCLCLLLWRTARRRPRTFSKGPWSHVYCVFTTIVISLPLSLLITVPLPNNHYGIGQNDFPSSLIAGTTASVRPGIQITINFLRFMVNEINEHQKVSFAHLLSIINRPRGNS